MSGLCAFGGGLADLSFDLLIYLVPLYLVYSLALSVILPPKRLENVSESRANSLIASNFVLDEALAAFNKSGRMHLRFRRYFAVGIALLGVLFLVAEQVCFEA